MKKLLLTVLLVSPCFAGEPVIPRAALRQVHLVMVAGIAAVQAPQDHVVMVDRPQAKNMQPKKYVRDQKNQKFPKNHHIDNKRQSRR